MRIGMVVPSISRVGGGVAEIALHLSHALRELDSAVEIVSVADEFSTTDLSRWFPLAPRLASRLGPAPFGYAPFLGHELTEANPDIVHRHGVWQWSSVVCERWSRRTGRPVLFTAHGMLEPWALQNSRWKKKAAMLAYERRVMDSAAAVHVNTELEAMNIKALGIRTPVAVIANGVSEHRRSQEPPAWQLERNEKRPVLLYLGRIHPKKGLMNLVRAIAGAPTFCREWNTVVAGWDDGGHLSELEDEIARLDLGDRVHLVGPVFGEQKRATLDAADAFILPSFSEGQPMSALEAMSASLPILMTSGCNCPEAFSSGAADEIDPSVESVRAGLERLAGTSDTQRAAQGRRGRDLVTSRFSWKEVASKSHSLYAWLLGDGDRPDFVMT